MRAEIGTQLHEEARNRFGWKADGVKFSAPIKEELAFGLRTAFEHRQLRIVSDQSLRSDLRTLKKETISSGNIRFDSQIEIAIATAPGPKPSDSTRPAIVPPPAVGSHNS